MQIDSGENHASSSAGGPVLLAIVEVPERLRVVCCNSGCGRSVYRAVHVVRDNGQLLVLGSTCFERRYGHGALGAPRFGGGQGRTLSAEEREMLANNTAALIARFEAELQKQLALDQATRDAAVRSPVYPSQMKPPAGYAPVTARPLSSDVPALSLKPNDSPWPWRNPQTEMTGFLLKDGSGWVRVVHQDRHHRLMPWPAFPGWESLLPSDIATPDMELGGFFLTDLVGSVQFLRRLQARDVRTIKWRDVRALLER